MRADAARNLEAVLTTGARMLTADPGASTAADVVVDTFLHGIGAS
ncbi:hypothetical protein [Streptomyces carpinensis]|uniref:TetR family transcriptional regulator n=1 Tax=Streptomyces carpinensis TaxID=66369 RepID=A0ABV1W0G8_9ACTN|nr:hypothetical protein [Streptomyces carpinensis]